MIVISLLCFFVVAAFDFVLCCMYTPSMQACMYVCMYIYVSTYRCADVCIHV